MRAQRIQRLETLVAEALKRLKKLDEENARLRSRLAAAEAEQAKLEGRLKRFGALGQRQERIRARLERVARKIDKAMELAG